MQTDFTQTSSIVAGLVALLLLLGRIFDFEITEADAVLIAGLAVSAGTALLAAYSRKKNRDNILTDQTFVVVTAPTGEFTPPDRHRARDESGKDVNPFQI